MKTFKKVLIFTVSIVTGLIVVGSFSAWLFKDDIIRQFIREANKNLNTPVTIGKVDLSLWSAFPDLSIEFTDVYVEDSHAEKYPLLTAKSISFSLNPWDAYKGNYQIKGLTIIDSETTLKIDAQGVGNYAIVKNSPEPRSRQVIFDLRNVRLENTRVIYHDLQTHSRYNIQSRNLHSSIAVKNRVYAITAEGDITTDEITANKKTFLQDKTFDVEANLAFDQSAKTLKIENAILKLNKSIFEIKGNYSFQTVGEIDLLATGKNTDVRTLISLLPADVSENLSAYKSDGDIYISARINGKIGELKSPGVTISFGCKNATIFNPGLRSRIEHATFIGSFICSSLTDLSHASVVLKNVSGSLNGKKFECNFSLEDFDDPLVDATFIGDLDAASIPGLYPVEGIKTISGEIHADVSVKGRISLLKKRSTAQQMKTQGSIDLRNIGLTAGLRNIKFTDIGGSLQFNNNDLALSNVTGKFENSDFRLNGFLKNVITWLLFDNQHLGIEADLKSDYLDLNQLFAIGFSEKGSGDFNFSISPYLHLNFDCDIRELRYKRFHARDVRGDLLLKNQAAVSRNFTFKSMGGSVSLNGVVDAKNPKAIDLTTSFNLSGLQLDSVFYVFENFDQNFIEDKHLKGLTNADVSIEMTLNEKLKLFPETLIADIGISIRNGELNGFEPLQKLNKYLDDEGLSHLRFADLKNEIHIEKKTVYIPQMEIKSNVTTIQVSGTHTFDQHIDYRLVAPLHNRKKIDRDAAFGAIEEDNAGESRIFLKVIGTTDKYTVSYDKDAVKKKIKSDLKKEVKELKDAFKNKGIKKKKDLELEKEEYFDWDAPEIKKD